MRFVPLVLIAFTVSLAAAQPAPRTTFATETRYSECQESWAFACGMRDASGNTYGTAHPMKHCTTYTFSTDGTYRIAGDLPLTTAGGTYRIGGTQVVLTQRDDDGSKRSSELPLAKISR